MSSLRQLAAVSVQPFRQFRRPTPDITRVSISLGACLVRLLDGCRSRGPFPLSNREPGLPCNNRTAPLCLPGPSTQDGPGVFRRDSTALSLPSAELYGLRSPPLNICFASRAHDPCLVPTFHMDLNHSLENHFGVPGELERIRRAWSGLDVVALEGNDKPRILTVQQVG